MSRSYKKKPYCTDGRNGRKFFKRQANKVVRHCQEEISNGSSYKNLYCSWNIHDYVSRWTWAEAKKEYEEQECNSFLLKKYPTLKSFYRYWSRCCKRK